jgi:formylmethanofuran dehydrogenase subunit A
MLTKEDMANKLKSIGLMKAYKPYLDDENGCISLETRKFDIIDGSIKGCRIDISDDKVVVWTSQKSKASAVAKAMVYKIRLFDGEAELTIPGNQADQFLHGFGAKVKKNRIYTPEQKAMMTLRLANARKSKVATPA